MSIKPEDKILTYKEAKELKFFMRNVTGIKKEYYLVLDIVQQFANRLEALDKTCVLIDKHFGKEIEEFEKKLAERFAKIEKETANDKESVQVSDSEQHEVQSQPSDELAVSSGSDAERHSTDVVSG